MALELLKLSLESQNSPLHVAKLQQKAMHLLMMGDIIPAIDSFLELIAIRSTQVADDWYNLAYLLRCNRQFDEALLHYDRALELGISRPQDVLINRAAILSEHLNRQDEAIASLHSALAYDPAYLPALLNLATILEDCGHEHDARATYLRVLEHDPLNGRAHGRLTAIDIYQGQADMAFDRLISTMATSGIRPDDLPEFHFAMGLTLDSLGRFDEAFYHFVQGNSLARSQIPDDLSYDRAKMDALIDTIIATFSISSVKQAPFSDVGSPPDPIFICGLFRSGSTLAERLLGRHPMIMPGGERETIPAIVRQLEPYPQAVAKLSGDEEYKLRSQYLHEIYSTISSPLIFTDKRPDNFLHIGLIKKIFPQSKIIHTYRNTLDNILSIYFLYLADSVSYGFDIDDIVHYWRCHERLMHHWHMLFGDDIIELDYDRLVRDPESVMRSVFAALNLSWETNCAYTVNDNSAVKTASSWHVRKPLTDRSSGRWRNYAHHLETVRRTLSFP